MDFPWKNRLYFVLIYQQSFFTHEKFTLIENCQSKKIMSEVQGFLLYQKGTIINWGFQSLAKESFFGKTYNVRSKTKIHRQFCLFFLYKF
jgi:hypothetical protein